MKIWFNGQVLDADTPIIAASSRAWQYGDGFFESMKAANYTLLFAEFHLQRINKTLQFLQCNTSLNFDIKKEIHQLLQVNQCPHARVKCTFLRKGSGMYLPNNTEFDLIITIIPLEDIFYTKKNIFEGYIMYDYPKLCVPMSNYKTTSAIPYILASIEASKKPNTIGILPNTNNNIAECQNANIVFVKENYVLQTPPLSEGCLDGVGIMVLQDAIKDSKFTLRKEKIAIAQLNQFQACFAINVSGGLTTIGKINDNLYTKFELVEELIELMNVYIEKKLNS